MLQRLFYTPGRQFELTKRWNEWDGVIEATALAEIAGQMDVTGTSPTRGEFVADVLLADPYFYGEVIETDLDPTQEGDTPSLVTITNPGDVLVDRSWITIELLGRMKGPLIVTNETRGVAAGVAISDLLADESVMLDVALSTATHVAADDTETNVINLVSSSGARSWMELEPGDNDFWLSSTGGSSYDIGHATVRFRPVYL